MIIKNLPEQKKYLFWDEKDKFPLKLPLLNEHQVHKIKLNKHWNNDDILLLNYVLQVHGKAVWDNDNQTEENNECVVTLYFNDIIAFYVWINLDLILQTFPLKYIKNKSELKSRLKKLSKNRYIEYTTGIQYSNDYPGGRFTFHYCRPAQKLIDLIKKGINK